MINEVLDIINAAFAGIHKDQKVYGIAMSIMRQSGSVLDRLPGIPCADGEIKYVGIDDVYALMIYHKLNGTTITQNRNTGVGNRLGDYQNVFSMSALVYWDRKRINLQPDAMLMLLQSRLPNGVTGMQDVKQITIQPATANTNTYQLYRQEYEYNDSRLLPENKHIIQLNYNIQITFNPECFRQCPECTPQ